MTDALRDKSTSQVQRQRLEKLVRMSVPDGGDVCQDRCLSTNNGVEGSNLKRHRGGLRRRLEEETVELAEMVRSIGTYFSGRSVPISILWMHLR